MQAVTKESGSIIKNIDSNVKFTDINVESINCVSIYISHIQEEDRKGIMMI